MALKRPSASTRVRQAPRDLLRRDPFRRVMTDLRGEQERCMFENTIVEPVLGDGTFVLEVAGGNLIRQKKLSDDVPNVAATLMAVSHNPDSQQEERSPAHNERRRRRVQQRPAASDQQIRRRPASSHQRHRRVSAGQASEHSELNARRMKPAIGDGYWFVTILDGRFRSVVSIEGWPDDPECPPARRWRRGTLGHERSSIHRTNLTK